MSFDYTFILYLRLLNSNSTDPRLYVLDAGIEPAPRISLTLESNERLSLSWVEMPNTRRSVSCSSKLLLAGFQLLICQVGNTEGRAYAAMYLGDQIQDRYTSVDPLNFQSDPFNINFVIGASIQGSASASFELSEQMVFSRLLTLGEISQISTYVNQRHQGRPTSTVVFQNGAYLIRDRNTGNMVQPEPSRRPKFSQHP